MDGTQSKRYDQLAALLVVLFAISFAVTGVGEWIPVLFPNFADSQNFTGLTLQVKTLAAVRAFFSSIVSVGCGVWLFAQASQHGRRRWVWLALALLGGGVTAVVLWFLVQIHQNLQALRLEQSEEKHNKAPQPAAKSDG